MTCIAGIIDDGNIWIGADSAGVDGYKMTRRSDTKVFSNGPFIMGFTTSFRMGQILQYSFSPPEHPKNCETDEFMRTFFVDSIRKCMKKEGYAAVYDGREEGGTFLVGYDKRLFEVHDDFQVGESLYTFSACGCGEDIALGSLFSTQNVYDSKSRILLALKASEEFSAGVRSPFRIMVLSRNGKCKTEIVEKISINEIKQKKSK